MNGGNKDELMEKFKNAVSKGFDPDVDLVKVGLANQTTMYKEKLKVGRIFEVAVKEVWSFWCRNYSEFDTISDATRRQDAVIDLVTQDGIFKGQDPVDFVLVVGGLIPPILLISRRSHTSSMSTRFKLIALNV